MSGRNLTKTVLTPEPDGVNRRFYVPVPYKPGTISVWLNGIKTVAGWDDGYDETGDTEITMKEAPLPGDSLQAEYDPL